MTRKTVYKKGQKISTKKVEKIMEYFALDLPASKTGGNIRNGKENNK